MRKGADAAGRLLPIAIVFGLLAGCGQQPVAAPPARSAKSDIDEVDALVAATKQHPSLVNPANNAGPPIHVDPLPKTGGMVHQHMTK